MLHYNRVGANDIKKTKKKTVTIHKFNTKCAMSKIICFIPRDRRGLRISLFILLRVQ